MIAILALENGLRFSGDAFGAEGTVEAELVFNTAMSGYQEVITDPSYRNQIVNFCAPQIGNYGINPKDGESDRCWLSGIVVREISSVVSNFRSTISLPDYLKEHNVVGISGVDTRAITLAVREFGAMEALITTENLSEKEISKRLEKAPVLSDLDPVSEVTRTEPGEWTAAASGDFLPPHPFREGITQPFKVAVIDFGAKHNILRNLVQIGCDLTVFPASTSAEEIVSGSFDGLFLSNGPGDPVQAKAGIELVKTLQGKLPIFGICLGHQIIALALGMKTYKLKFGHHGVNHPVQNKLNMVIEITSQNHGYAVDMDSLPAGIEVTHVNLNDQTCSGLRHEAKKIMCVQYHPESAPGPHDSHYLFHDFMELMKQHRGQSAGKA